MFYCEKLFIIIFIIVLLLLSAVIISEFIKNKEDQNNKKEIVYNYGLFGGDYKNNQIILPKKFPQVGILTNHVLRLFPLSAFVWLEKTDGEHINLAIKNNKTFYVNYGNFDPLAEKFPEIKNKLKNIVLPNNSASILDCELYNNKLYVFDAYIVDNVNLNNKTFMERMEAARNYIEKYNLFNLFEVKQYYEIDENNFEKLLEQIYNTDVSPKTGNRVDGAIFQLKNQKYLCSKHASYKLKRRCLNTIDFLLKFDKNKEMFYLFLSGKKENRIFNNQIITFNKEFGNENSILFSSPLFKDLHVYKPVLEWNEKGYSPKQIAEINALIGNVFNNPEKYDGKIIEMSLTDANKWVPMRIRKDKLYPNSYKVGLANCGIMYAPITGEKTYFHKNFNNSPFSLDFRIKYHNINQTIRQYVFYKCYNNYKDVLFSSNSPDIGQNMVLDLCGGRGGDVIHLLKEFEFNLNNFFVLDSDKYAISQYMEKLEPNNGFLKEMNIKPRDVILSQGFQHTFNDVEEDTKNIIDNIKSSYNYVNKNGFKVILMNYSIHYFCTKPGNLVQLKNIIKELLAPNGIFIFSYFDGDKIFNSLKKYGTLRTLDEKKNIKIFDKIKLIKTEHDGQICLMALPTISETGYKEEPLVFNSFLNILTDDEELRLDKVFSPCVEMIKNNEITKTEMTDYLEYIKIGIITKN